MATLRVIWFRWGSDVGDSAKHSFFGAFQEISRRPEIALFTVGVLHGPNISSNPTIPKKKHEKPNQTVAPTPKVFEAACPAAPFARLTHSRRNVVQMQAMACLFLVRSSRPPDGQRITACGEKGLMNIAGLRSIYFAVLLVLLAGASCNRSKRA